MFTGTSGNNAHQCESAFNLFIIYRELRKNVKQLQIHGGTPFDDFLSILLSSTMLHDRKCELFTLYQFILTRPALNIGAIVLPKLVDLYSWIHNNLQFKVTSEIAKSQSVRTVLESLLDQFFPGKKVKEMAKIEVLISKSLFIFYAVSTLTQNNMTNIDIFPNACQKLALI